MSVISSSLKATISFGGVVSQSFTRSTRTLNSSLQTTERQAADLTRQQKELARQIRAGALAGQDVRRLRGQYERLSEQIRDTEREQSRLNRSMRMRGAVTGTLRGGMKAGGLAATGTAIGLGGLMAAGAGAVAINAHTNEQVGMARSYGVSANTFRAWDGVGKQMGLSGESFGDLGEELANKIGEMKALGKQSSVTDSFAMMGLNLKDLEGKSNEEQLALVLNRAQKMGDSQESRAAVDILLSGEANKILAWMRQSGKTYEQLMATQKRYILTTDETDEAAGRGQFALSNLWVSVSTAAQAVVGSLMGDLAPSITKCADELVSWFKGGGKDLLVGGVKGFATGLMDFWNNDLQPVVTSLWQGLKWLAEFIENHFASYETEFARAETAEDVRMAAEDEYLRQNNVKFWDLKGNFEQSSKAKAFGESEVAKKQALLDEPNKQRWRDSHADLPLGADLDAKLKGVLSQSSTSPGQKPVGQQTNHMNITVMTQPGDDAQQIGEAVGGKVFDVMTGAVADGGMWTPASLGG